MVSVFARQELFEHGLSGRRATGHLRVGPIPSALPLDRAPSDRIRRFSLLCRACCEECSQSALVTGSKGIR